MAPASGLWFMPDSNVFFDVVLQDQAWAGWSSAVLAASGEVGAVVINQVIFAEVSSVFQRIEDAREMLANAGILTDDLPWDAAFLAGQAFRAYRRRGGVRTTTLPDFFIGAHALLRGYTLITRDPRRYRTYFPNLKLVAPEP
ncbi:MAG: type II toxin-antitoxin system VapC family toxin [Dehalococcoidia bacterium]